MTKLTKEQSGRYNTYKKDAKRRKLEWDVSEDLFLSMWQNPCSYCGKSIATIGLDRKDNKVGYTPANITSCCKDCNFYKGVYSESDFLQKVQEIYFYQLGKALPEAIASLEPNPKLVADFLVDHKPVSTNSGYKIGHRRMRKTAAAEEWQQAVADACPISTPSPTKKYYLEIDFYFRATNCDVDGPCKFVLDALQDKVYVNDKQVWRIQPTKYIDSKHPRAVVRVYELPEEEQPKKATKPRRLKKK